MEQLKKYISSQVAIDAQEMQIILSHFKEHLIKKERHLLKQGQIATQYIFVKSGGLRVYFDSDDKQITGWIALENEFFSELSSLRNGTPSRFYIQAIEDTTVLTIQHNDMERLYKQFPAWQQFGRLVWETAFLKVLDATIAYQTTTADERYIKLIESSDLLQRLPLKDLSSFLGITPTSLSRLRKKIKQQQRAS